MKCIKKNCYRDALTGSNYCYLHKPSTGEVMKFFPADLSVTELCDVITLTEAGGLHLAGLTTTRIENEQSEEIAVNVGAFESSSQEDIPPRNELKFIEVAQSDKSSLIHAEASKGFTLEGEYSAYAQGELTDLLVFRRF